jgi:PAS domain S-box-containing protein
MIAGSQETAMSTTLCAMILQNSCADTDRLLHELRMAGYHVDWHRIATREDFLDHLSPNVEIILADYALPQFTALEALQILRQRGLATPLIVVTGGVSEQAAVECMKRGAFDYLLTDQLAQLGPAVTRAIHARKSRGRTQSTSTETQQRNRELTLLNQIIAASAASLEPQSVLSKACRELALAFGIPHAVAFLLNDRARTVTFVAEHAPSGASRLVNTITPIAGNPVFEHILSQRTPLVANDGPDDPRLESIREALLDRNMSSILVVPLTIRNKVMGGIGLQSAEPYSFTVQQVGLAWRVADQLSSGIARARLDKERRLLTAAIRQTADSVIITDVQGTIVYVNPGFEQITGYKRTDVIGRHSRLLKSGDQDQAFYRDLWQTLAAGKTWRGRFVDRKKDGTIFTVDSSIAPVRDETGQVVNYVDVQRDVTHELQLEEQYLQAQKMEVVGQLAGGIAHDFNNLLTAIKGYTGLTLGSLDSLRSGARSTLPGPGTTSLDAGDLDTMRVDLEGIDSATDQAAGLVRQLMAFSRKQVLQPQILDLNTVVTNARKMLRHLIGEDIDLITQLDPDLGHVKADPGQIEQVIMNLAVNARDAMTNGGAFTLETSSIELKEDDSQAYPDLEPGAYVLLSASDTGTGMDREVLAHIFEPFFTTKEAGKGTGLGLATVHGIVSQTGGHIEVSSTVGVGTTFRIYLPCSAEKVSAAPQDTSILALPTGCETILVVEDEESVRDLTVRVLEQQGYTVLAAGHPKEALRWSEQHRKPIHLLLTDVIMPGMNGTGLARALTSSRPGLKILYVSGYTADAIARRVVLAPDVAFLQKPFTARALAREVRQLLDAP